MQKSIFESTLPVQADFIRQTSSELIGRMNLRCKKILTSRGTPSFRRVILLGTGSSFHVCMWGSWFFRDLGIEAISMRSWDYLMACEASATVLRPQDLVIVVSHRGAQNLTLDLLKVLKGSNAILICAEGAPTNGAAALFASPQEKSQAHSFSLMGAITALIEIGMYLKPIHRDFLNQEKLKTADFIDCIPEQIAFRVIPKLKKGAQLHFIGGGIFEAIAHELALKAKEMVHLPALSHQLEEFLHGPLAAVNSHDHCLLLNPHKPSETNSRQLSKMRKKLGFGRVQSCQNALSAIDAYQLKVALPPSLTQLGQSLVSLVYGQRICLEYARQRGTHPDTNRQEVRSYSRAFQCGQY